LAKPAIFTIDDDPMVLNAIERDLRKRYGQDYRVVSVNQGQAALNYLKQMKQRNEMVALFLVDQRMPQMSGTEFLVQARPIFSEAKRLLLTAYADTQAAIDSINQVGLDYYLMKPWDPPEERLYPVLDEMLADWKAHARLPYEGIRVAGTLWSMQSHEVKDFLARHQIPYQWLDIESNPMAHQLVTEVNQGDVVIPTVFFPDGSVMTQPTLRDLAEKAGLQTRAERPFYDLVIIGAGPAGLAAAVYAGSEGLRTLVLERQAPGGQASRSPRIENYLGFPTGISGDDLARRAVTQARRFNTEILSAQEAQQISIQHSYRIVHLADESEISCYAVLLATGATFHLLKMPGAAALNGAGVYYGAAYTEATYYQGKDVIVVGGANSAGQAAIYLSRFASKVTVLMRGPEPTASKYLVDELRDNEKIELLLDTDLIEVKGQDRLEEVIVRNNQNNETRSLRAAALFVFIGVEPQSKLVAGLAKCDEKGYVLTGVDLLVDGKRPEGWPLERDPYLLETSVPGIFAAGDVRYGTSHRVASAVGEGAIAVALIRQYLRSL